MQRNRNIAATELKIYIEKAMQEGFTETLPILLEQAKSNIKEFPRDNPLPELVNSAVQKGACDVYQALLSSYINSASDHKQQAKRIYDLINAINASQHPKTIKWRTEFFDALIPFILVYYTQHPDATDNLTKLFLHDNLTHVTTGMSHLLNQCIDKSILGPLFYIDKNNNHPLLQIVLYGYEDLKKYLSLMTQLGIEEYVHLSTDGITALDRLSFYSDSDETEKKINLLYQIGAKDLHQRSKNFAITEKFIPHHARFESTEGLNKIDMNFFVNIRLQEIVRKVKLLESNLEYRCNMVYNPPKQRHSFFPNFEKKFTNGLAVLSLSSLVVDLNLLRVASASVAFLYVLNALRLKIFNKNTINNQPLPTAKVEKWHLQQIEFIEKLCQSLLKDCDNRADVSAVNLLLTCLEEAKQCANSDAQEILNKLWQWDSEGVRNGIKVENRNLLLAKFTTAYANLVNPVENAQQPAMAMRM